VSLASGYVTPKCYVFLVNDFDECFGDHGLIRAWGLAHDLDHLGVLPDIISIDVDVVWVVVHCDVPGWVQVAVRDAEACPRSAQKPVAGAQYGIDSQHNTNLYITYLRAAATILSLSKKHCLNYLPAAL
jgi:hypothetical protein